MGAGGEVEEGEGGEIFFSGKDFEDRRISGDVKGVLETGC